MRLYFRMRSLAVLEVSEGEALTWSVGPFEKKTNVTDKSRATCRNKLALWHMFFLLPAKDC